MIFKNIFKNLKIFTYPISVIFSITLKFPLIVSSLLLHRTLTFNSFYVNISADEITGFSHLTQCKEQEYTRNQSAGNLSVLNDLNSFSQSENFVPSSDIMSKFVFLSSQALFENFGGW